MKQLAFVRKGRLRWDEVAEPTLQGPGEALVRPLAVARCDADRLSLVTSAARIWRVAEALHLLDDTIRELFGHAPFRGPYPFGHECVAEVISCGDAVADVRVGQRVVVPFQISCGQCARCRSGLTGYCTAVAAFSAYGFGTAGGDWGGALSDVLRVPFADAMLVPVPDGIDPASVASAGDNLSDAWRTVGPHLEQHPGAAVLIVGGDAGSIGLYAAAIALAMGAAQVDYLDTDQPRLELAQSLGAQTIEGKKPHPGTLYPITVNAGFTPASLDTAVRAAEPGGVCTSVGIYPRKHVPVPLFAMYSHGVTLHTGLINARATIPNVLSLIDSGRLHPERVTTCLAHWDDAAEALLDPSAKVIVARE